MNLKKRIHLKKRHRKIAKSKIWLWSIIFVIIMTYTTIHVIGTKVNPILLSYAQIETKRFATLLINQSVTEELVGTLEMDNLFVINKTETGEIQTVDFNPAIVNKVLALASKAVQKKITALENGDIEELPSSLAGMNFTKLKEGIVCEIPLGILTGNSLLSNLGPRFPVRLSFLGDVITNIRTKIDSYGINNALVTISIKVELTERITMPLSTKEETIEIDIPVAIKMVQGKVPTYYQNGLDKNSNIFSLPLQ